MSTVVEANPLLVLRAPNAKIPPQLLYEECKELTTKTTYIKHSRQEDAPQSSDCLTAIAYILKRTLYCEFKLDWIGNMPRLLVNEEHWEALLVNQTELHPGDLLFLGRRKGGVVTHVALALTSEEAFHCNWESGGGSIEKIKTLFSKYIQAESQERLLSYQDPRSTLPPLLEKR